MLGLDLTLPRVNSGPFLYTNLPTISRQVPPFDRWLPTVTPAYDWRAPHLRYIQQHLARVTSGETSRLMIFLPPQHGKSQMCTIRYPVWRLEREPHLRVIVGAYNQHLANRFSRAARKIAATRLDMDSQRQAVEEWQTAAGGVWRAVGVGSGITGQGGDLIIIDDPTKSREEAESQVYRERVWDWYTDDLFTRQGPNVALILIQTRWHGDDLAGRILASDDGPNWTVVSLPALAEGNDPLGRTPGDPLWPARYDGERLAQFKRVLGSYGFSALYQQRPVPHAGGLFKRDWFQIVDAAPYKATRLRYWDKGGTEGGGDPSAGVKIARAEDGICYIEDCVTGQWSAMNRERIIRQTAELDTPAVAIYLEQEPGSSGKESAESSIRNLSGYSVHAEPVTGDKVTRAMPFAAQCEAGNVKIVRGPWNAAYLDELCSFPYGKHDDQVDGSSGAFNKLTLRKRAGTW